MYILNVNTYRHRHAYTYIQRKFIRAHTYKHADPGHGHIWSSLKGRAYIHIYIHTHIHTHRS